jgi:hypothetical protein
MRSNLVGYLDPMVAGVFDFITDSNEVPPDKILDSAHSLASLQISTHVGLRHFDLLPLGYSLEQGRLPIYGSPDYFHSSQGQKRGQRARD